VTDINELVSDIAAGADVFNTNYAAAFADWAVDYVIERLRRDPRMPRLSRHEWELALADLRGELTFGLAELIDHRDSPFDIAQRVLDSLVLVIKGAAK
jgi:hypothetical protein